MRPYRSLLAVGMFGLGVLLGQPPQAAAVSLAQLIATDGSVTVGDKVFSDFSAAFFTGLDLGDVTVTGIAVGEEHGLSFTGNFVTGFGLAPLIQAGIGFTVLSENFITGFTVEDELVVNAPPGAEFEFAKEVSVELNQVSLQEFQVNTLIRLETISADPGAIAAISFVNELFAQSPVPIPEPSSVLLLASGLAGIALRRRGKK